ncbi:DNA primase [Moraxella nasovis]|uniref:DNA primase n=1 Tax=Moraxella nasovis TaxID=2904121 RepID=UPI001F60EBF7|nr:DNA primase [Moraxella nasovis]UNU73401.1 DNA primase [Moraxella nasovis]
MQISESVIEQLNSHADLVGMIRKHTALKPAGRELKGCCPFHGEKTPSFFVNPQTNLYYCFGCGAKGNPITFLRELERMTFIEAVKHLSDQTGIELPKDDEFAKKISYKKSAKSKPVFQSSAKPSINPPNQHLNSQSTTAQSNNIQNNNNVITNEPFDTIFTDEDKISDGAFIINQVEDEQGDLYTLLANVCRYYQSQLWNTPFALSYFQNRGLTQETIHTFELGFAPHGWQVLTQAFAQDLEGLKILGLVRQSQKTGEYYDFFRERVIFPIKDRQGRVVGFAGRSLGDDMPKYINSSESPVFQKQHILYGLYEARQAKANDFLMVEGYMDVIALHQAGIYGAVAPMGTAANERQIAQLLKYNDVLTLCFDGDNAGQRAAWRTLEVAAPVLPDGKQLKFLTLPNQHDPDTFIKQHGAAAMVEQIAHASNLSDYVFGVLARRYDLKLPENKAAAMAELKELAAKLPKGSSFRWWLNNDIYQKLSGKNLQKTQLLDQANYDTNVNHNIQLYLCLLYAPQILLTDPLSDILTQSGAVDVHADFIDKLEQQELHLPELPTWKSIGDEALSLFVSTIKELITLSQSMDLAGFDLTDTDPKNRAYFIIASLPNPSLQDMLASQWQDFYQQISQQSVNIQFLFQELLSQALQETLQKQHKNSKNLILSEIHKRRLQAVIHWDKHNKSKLAKLLDT